MKRRNIQLAFTGEGQPTSADVDQLEEGDEAIDVGVEGGKLMLVVKARTPDDQIFGAATLVGGELLLEDGRRFSFEIHPEAEGAQYSLIEGPRRDDTHPDLSSIPNIPGGT